jgi:uncharacterized protein YqjF (DUF2071 family)
VDRDRSDPRFHGNAAPDAALLRIPGEFRGRYRATSEVFRAEPGTLEHFLAERYCLYVVERGKVYRAEIHHVPWPLQRAEAQIEANTIIRADGLELPGVTPPGPAHLMFAQRLDVLVWLPYRVTIS